MNSPQFKIHGKERKILKKELAEARRFVKDFWYYHQMDKDMASFYGSTRGYPMSDERAQAIYDKWQDKANYLQEILDEPYEHNSNT